MSGRSVVQSKYSGRYLYCIVYEQWKRGRWEAQDAAHIYADTEGEARWFFLMAQGPGVRVNVIAAGLAIGFFDTGEKKLVHGVGVRADEYKPKLTA